MIGTPIRTQVPLRSSLLRAYLAFSRVSFPLWRREVDRRIARGKEDPSMRAQRLGQSFARRPPGPVLWLHALSVGESLAVLPLIERALDDRDDLTVLLTSATRSSAEAIARAGLPAHCIHQMLPVDAPGPVRAFLDHWRPAVAVVTELDLWPRALVETRRRGVPMALINCRFSDKNVQSRRIAAGAYRDLFALFDRVILQDEESLKRLRAFGVKTSGMTVGGALKGAARPLPADPDALQSLKTQMAGRSRWLAASLHLDETAQTRAAHARVLKDVPHALLVLAPRHMRDADEMEAHMATLGAVARRSRGDAITPGTVTYLADTIGEMGLWYRLCPVTFVAHSLAGSEPPLRGKNPFEAIALGSVVLHGPEVADFSETYAELDATDAAIQVTGPEDLGRRVLEAEDEQMRAAHRAAAARVVAEKSEILAETWYKIAALLPDRA